MSAREELEPAHVTIERQAREIDRLTRGLELLAVDLENANVELAVKRRMITTLKQEIAGKVKAGSWGEQVDAAFRYWQAACNHPRTRLDHKRAKAIETMLRHRDEQGENPLLEVCRAIDGARFDAWVDEKGKRHDGISLICRDEDSFDRMRERWRTTITSGRLSVALNAYCLPGNINAAPFDIMEQGWRWKCPSCRLGWSQDHTPLLIGRGFIYCEGACVGVTLEMVREALLEHFPVVTS